MGAFTAPLRKGSHCSSLHHLHLTTRATRRTPEAVFRTIPGTNINRKPSSLFTLHLLPKLLPCLHPFHLTSAYEVGSHQWAGDSQGEKYSRVWGKRSDALSACDTREINMSTQQKHRKTSRPNLHNERTKLVSTDLLGYANMAKYADHHSRAKTSSFIEEPPSVLPQQARPLLI